MALLPPPEIQATASQIKQYFADRYSSRAAQKSPPHITLQPPFRWANTALPALEQCLSEFVLEQQSVPIVLDGFAAFPPRVIYINVLKTPELLTLQAALLTRLATQLGIIDRVSKTRPFTPHLTVAFKDLTPKNFHIAWAQFQQQQFYSEFVAAELTLLQHDGRRWNISRKFPLGLKARSNKG